jgi:Tfp pilus assembly protein PilN
MRDFNYFRPFIPSKIKKSSTGEWIGLGVFLIAIVMIAIPWYLTAELRSLRNEVTELEADVSDPTLQEDIDRVMLLQTELEELTTESEQMTQAVNTLAENETVNQQLLKDLAQAKINDIVFEQLTVNNDVITIQGLSLSREDIANLEYNIRQFERYENIFVPSITYSDDYYQFSITFNIKGGENLEELDE